MSSIDMIELTLSSPIDWGLFEKVCSEILAADDLPRLRRLGGYGDQGLDAVEEAFYNSESLIDSVVQITSQKAQSLKVEDTLEKLLKYKVSPRRLVIVFRDPCASGTRRDIQAIATKAGLQVDVRDRGYLIQQLALPGSNIFSRHFSNDVADQVQRLLNAPDVLSGATDSTKLAVLASLAVYTLGSHTRLVKGKLFERTVLATIAQSPTPLLKEEVASKVRSLLPESDIDDGQLHSALKGLSASREIEESRGRFTASESTLTKVGKTIVAVRDAYSGLQDWILSACRKEGRLDDATKGYIERNTREAVSLLIRLGAPFQDSVASTVDAHTERELHRLLSRNVTGSIGRTCLTALGAYVSTAERRAKLVPFVRAYTTLAIRNVDPLGKQWQSAVLSRSSMALDTDAVLKLIVVDLPEHKSIRDAISGLAAEGVRIVVATHVLAEAVGHIERASRTYNKFKDILVRLPLPSVDAKVWHAVVRGYAYACANGFSGGWEKYFARYYDADESVEYVQKILGGRAPIVIEDLYEIPEKNLPLLSELSTLILEKKEQSRLKAEFRGDVMMAQRVESDLRMLFCMAAQSTSSPNLAKGYLASEDRAFFFVEKTDAWRSKKKVTLMTRTLPELSNLVCGTAVDNSELVRLIFEPSIAATAELMNDELNALASVGAEMRDQSLEQLEWTLEKSLRKKIHAFIEADNQDDAERAGQLSLELLEETQRAGISLTKSVAEVASNYRTLKRTAEDDKAELSRLKASLQTALYEVAGGSGKAKTRANRMLRALGIEPPSTSESGATSGGANRDG